MSRFDPLLKDTFSEFAAGFVPPEAKAGGGRKNAARPHLWQNKSDDSWHVVWREAGSASPRRESCRTTTQAEAEAYFGNWLINRATPDAPEVPTIEEVVLHYVASKEGSVRSPDAIQSKGRNVIRTVGKFSCASVGSEAFVTEFYNRRRAEPKRRGTNGLVKNVGTRCKDATIRSDLALLRAALRLCRRHKWNIPDAALSIDMPEAQLCTRTRWLRKEEARRLMGAMKGSHLYTYTALGLGTGARMSAILDLTWDRVHFDTGHVDFDASLGCKLKRRVCVPMNDWLRGILEAAFAVRAEDCPFVVNYQGHKIASIRMGFNDYRRKAKLSADVSPHILRHTAATWMVMDGNSLEEVSKMIGDTIATVERHYAHLLPDFCKKAAASLQLTDTPPVIVTAIPSGL
jgi:integrase